MRGGADMSDIIKEPAAAVAAANAKKEDKPPRPPAYTCFVAEIRTEFHDKMEVFRWLINDDLKFFHFIGIGHGTENFSVFVLVVLAKDITVM